MEEEEGGEGGVGGGVKGRGGEGGERGMEERGGRKVAKQIIRPEVV